MVRSFGNCALLLVQGALAAAAQAQPAALSASAPVNGSAGTAATMTPMERARRDADKVFYWVKLHGNAQPRPAQAKDAAAPAATLSTTAVGANAAATAPKKPPPVRTAAASAADPTPAPERAASEPANDQVAAEPPAEPPALN